MYSCTVFLHLVGATGFRRMAGDPDTRDTPDTLGGIGS